MTRFSSHKTDRALLNVSSKNLGKKTSENSDIDEHFVIVCFVCSYQS